MIIKPYDDVAGRALYLVQRFREGNHASTDTEVLHMGTNAEVANVFFEFHSILDDDGAQTVLYMTDRDGIWKLKNKNWEAVAINGKIVCPNTM